MADLDEVIVPGHRPLAAPELLRLLPVEHVVPVDPRRAAHRRARRAGHELGDVAGVHRARDADARLDGRAARPARARSARRARTGGGVIQGSASEATLVAILSARWRATGGRGQRTTATRPGSSPTPRRRPTRASRRACASPASAPTGCASSPTTSRSPCVPDALAAMIAADRAAGLVPFFVCATHGTTSSMAFDPTPAIAADLPATHGVWLHVDAAMSGIAALAPEHRWVNDGLELADSYCTNPHKWMGVNFDCDLFWTADRAALLGALSILPEYLRSAAAETGRGDRLPRLADPARAPVPGAQAVVDAPPRRRRRDPGDDPPPRRADPAAGRRGRAPTTGSRSSPRTRSTCCASGSSPATTATDALIERANATGRGAVHPHRARRSRRRCASRSAPRRPSGATSPPPWQLLQSADPSSSARPRLAGRPQRVERDSAGREEVDEHVGGGAPDGLVVELEEVQQPVGRRCGPSARSGTCRAGRARPAAATAPARPPGWPGASGSVAGQAADDRHDVAAADDGVEVVELADHRRRAAGSSADLLVRLARAPPRPASRRDRCARPGS